MGGLLTPWYRVSIFFYVWREIIKAFLVGNCLTRILLLLCQDDLLKDKRVNKEAVSFLALSLTRAVAEEMVRSGRILDLVRGRGDKT